MGETPFYNTRRTMPPLERDGNSPKLRIRPSSLRLSMVVCLSYLPHNLLLGVLEDRPWELQLASTLSVEMPPFIYNVGVGTIRRKIVDIPE
jgi:hypothetical protein